MARSPRATGSDGRRTRAEEGDMYRKLVATEADVKYFVTTSYGFRSSCRIMWSLPKHETPWEAYTMTRTRRFAVPVSLGLLLIATMGAERYVALRVAAGQETIVDAATAFIQVLGEAEREKALYTLDDPERFNWIFVPATREGLALREMSAEQRMAAHALLAATTSGQGYQKAVGVMRLEEMLGQMEDRPDYRDPEDYHFWIFGEPSVTEPWGWRFEGHHVSLSFTSSDGMTVSTPSFIGANPARVEEGVYTGWRLLANEEDLARELLMSLDGSQRTRAVIQADAPNDIITGNDREVSITERSGLPASDMNAEQRDLLLRLVAEYTGNMEHSIASAQMAKIEEAGFGELHFAWAGSAEPGERHYYRIHGPTVLIEYDNTQNGANHIHSTWRDLTDDFGEDLLRRHYEESDHSH